MKEMDNYLNVDTAVFIMDKAGKAFIFFQM